MHRDMVGFIALNFILRIIRSGVVNVSFVIDISRMNLDDLAADALPFGDRTPWEGRGGKDASYRGRTYSAKGDPRQDSLETRHRGLILALLNRVSIIRRAMAVIPNAGIRPMNRPLCDWV